MIRLGIKPNWLRMRPWDSG